MSTSGEDGALRALYQEIILKHYRNPQNRGVLKNADVTIHMNNPTCGDEITLHVTRSAEGLAEVRFEGHGCSISQASASIMTDLVQGQSRATVGDLQQRFVDMLRGDSEKLDPALGEARALAGVAKFPTRVRCAMLPWSALQEAIESK